MELETQLRALLGDPIKTPLAHLYDIGQAMLGETLEYPDFVAQCRASGIAADLFAKAHADLDQGLDKASVWQKIRVGLTPCLVGGHPASPEQRAILSAAGRGQHLWIRAGAGASKTSTLAALAQQHPATTLYLAFNRGIADEARQRFPASVECKTLHALALRYLPDHLRDAANDLANPNASRDILSSIQQMLGDRWPVSDMHQWQDKFDGKAMINRALLRLILVRSWDVWLTQLMRC